MPYFPKLNFGTLTEKICNLTMDVYHEGDDMNWLGLELKLCVSVKPSTITEHLTSTDIRKFLFYKQHDHYTPCSLTIKDKTIVGTIISGYNGVAYFEWVKSNFEFIDLINQAKSINPDKYYLPRSQWTMIQKSKLLLQIL